MILKTIIFRRKKSSPIEVGIEVEGSVILDRQGKVVPAPIYNAKDVIGILLDTTPILDELSKIKRWAML